MKKNMITIHTLGLDENELNIIDKFFTNHTKVEFKSVSKIDELKKELKKYKIKYLIADKKCLNDEQIEFIKNNSIYFLNIKTLFFTEKDDLSNNEEDYLLHFKFASLVPKNSTYMKLSTSLTDLFIETPYSKNIIYLALKINLFENLEHIPCDIFIKLSDKKFIKILSADQKESPNELINKYILKGVSEVYFESTNLNKVRKLIEKEIFKSDLGNADLEKKLKIADNVITIAKDFGVSDILIEGINETFTEINQDLQKDKKLKSLLNLINAKSKNPLINHSYLTAVFCSIMASKVTWSTTSIKKNLCMASLLHDLDIIESENVDFEFKSLPEIKKLDKKKSFINHPTSLAKKLSENNNVPSDVISLISKHHEGAGLLQSYPVGVNANQLTPPNYLFNTAHQFTLELSKIGFNQNKIDLAMKRLKEHFDGKQFLPFIEILEIEIGKMNI